MRPNLSKMLLAAVVVVCAWPWPRVQGQELGYGDLPGDRIEVLTRGPVHEAFAEPIALTEENVMTVTVQPPAPIAEAAPSDMPDTPNVAWIPGYWTWDADINNFLWVSGCWRVPPPDHSWVPGYWAQVQAGWQWVPGFWSPTDATEIQYLPPPPASLDEGPIGDAPSDSDTWAPGCWKWQGGRYAWRHGYWQAAHADWQWIPSHYVWTPRGCIFVEGHWDYSLAKRGLLFSPIFCPTRVYDQAGFAYTPSVVIDTELLVKNLFCCPRHDHYYFGDYYDSRYERQGIFPWFAAASHHEYFDPIFAHRQWKHRDNHEWFGQVKDEYVRRQRDPEARPARTYSALRAQMEKLPEARRSEFHVARPISSYVENKESPLKFKHIEPQHQAEIIRQTAAIHDFKSQRKTWEAPPARTVEVEHGPGPVVGTTEVKPVMPAPHIIVPPPHVDKTDHIVLTDHGVGPAPVFIKPETPRVQVHEKEPLEFTPHTAKLPASPVVGPKTATFAKEVAPPTPHVVPTPNPEIKPRFSGGENLNDDRRGDHRDDRK